jgi:pilus assembly protein CpaB
VLRNQTDPMVSDSDGATKSMLLGAVKPAAAPEPATKPVARRSAPRSVAVVSAVAPPVRAHCVEVIRGINKVTECF